MATHEQLYIQKHNKGIGDRWAGALQPSRDFFHRQRLEGAFAGSGEQETGPIWAGVSDPKMEALLYFLIGNDLRRRE